MIHASVICDSITPRGDDRLTTMELEFPRFILAEFNTHRVFSRNSASSRAIPIKKIIKRVREDPYIPTVFMENKPGMQAATPIEEQEHARGEWLWARDQATYAAHQLGVEWNVHKQWANRLLEPFMWHRVIVTSHEWENFFKQRCSPLAQPEMRSLADAMNIALSESKPRVLETGEWHLPLVTGYDDVIFAEGDITYGDVYQAEISAARCARVSYLTHHGTRDLDEDSRLFHDTLKQFGHASPMEHPAMVAGRGVRGDRNFGEGWLQLRQLLRM